MSLIKSILNRIGFTRSANDFVSKFIRDSKTKHCQLELYYRNEIVLQLESLKFTPIWADWAGVDINKFINGFVVHFFLEKKRFR